MIATKTNTFVRSDAEWAQYLECPPSKVTFYRKWVDDRYSAVIEKDNISKKYRFALYKYEIIPDGSKRPIGLITSITEYDTKKQALDFANCVIPTLRLSEVIAEMNKVPVKCIQMLRCR
ncbi:MAG: hypothetical protein MJ158_00200 [Alphaproteobacteria bacterium]|nr:hypothetical protein [Alphaproteobacteria bacterium]